MKNVFYCMILGLMILSCTKESIVNEVNTGLEPRAGVCTNIPSFILDEKRVAPGSYSLIINYSVKPCDKTVPVSVNMKITNFRTKELVSDYTDAPLDLKLFWGGLAVGDWYQVQVIVNDATTGNVIESKILSLIIRSKI